MAVNESPISIVGCGPGSLDYVAPCARRAIERAEVLVGAKRLLDLFPESDAERIPVGVNIEKALEAIAGRYESKRVAVLVSGDPGLCSLAQPVLKRFGREACQVIPGVSSVQVAFARIGLDWLDARLISAHSCDPEVDATELVSFAKIAILAGREGALRWIANVAKSVGRDYAVFVCENLTLPEERVREVEPAGLEELCIASKSIVLLIKRSLLP